MCGIAGWYNRDGRPVDPDVLRRMSDTMIHRGPDAGGVWTRGPIGLAHRRLSIRDLSPAGRQPMGDPTGRIMVTYNGELYNDRELRAELERDFGVRFRTSCDTEILPHAYLAWGDAMFDRLEGMYAIGLWDSEHERLLLARDGIGIKPIYFAETSERVLFASELKGILAHGAVTAELDPEALHTFSAAGHAGTAASLVRGIEQVPPGSVIAISARDRRTRQFWRPHRDADIDDLDWAVELLSRTLDDVVEGQLISDVPLSVLQSGGIDSSLVSLAVGRRGVTAPLFTAGFAEASHDETGLAAEVAKAAGLPQRVIPIDTAGDLGAVFRATVHHFDGQCADTGAIAFYRLSQAVRRHSTVVLSGDGGDEFFCGYETYAASRVAEVLRGITPPALARSVGRFAYGVNPANEGRLPAASVVARFALGLSEGGARPHLEWRRLVPGFLARQVYGAGMDGLAGASPYREYAAYYDGEPGDVLDRAMIADQRFHLQSVLAKVDAMSMAHSLEVRVPLLDRRVMDLAGRMGLGLLHPRKGPPKYLLRVLAERLGAPQSVTRARKKGFNVPISRLLRNELRPLADEVLEREADVLAPYLRPDEIRALWRAHRDREADHAFALWPILTLATWRAGLARPESAPVRQTEPVRQTAPV